MKTALQLLVGGVIGFSFVYIAAFAGIEWSLDQIGIVILTMIVSFPIHILLHELGHVLFGYTQGMKLMNMSVGPLVIERYQGRWHFHFSPAVLAYAGRAMMFFPEHLPKEQMKKKLIVYLLGGAAINIGTGVLFILTGLFLFDHYLFVILGMMGIFIGFSNLIPEYNKAVSTDGFAIKQLRSENLDDSIMMTTYALLTESEITNHSKDWSLERIQDMSRIFESNTEDPRTKVLIQQLSYYYLPEQPEEIIRLGKRYAFSERGKKPDLLQDIANIYYIAACYFKGECSNDEEVRRVLDQIGKLDQITYQKKLAFTYILNGQNEMAVEELKHALRLLERWNSLYMRGKEEKEHINALLLKISEREIRKQVVENFQ